MRKIKVRIIELAKPGMDLVISEEKNVIRFKFVPHLGSGM
jgi:hypothetical protein